MEYKSCIHTHTQFCDGKSSMADFCKRAAQLGYRSIGFTPHSPLPYESDWAMKKEDLIAYLEEIRYLKGYYEEELDVLCGVEWDSETPEPFIEAEYVIGSVHSFSKKGVHFSVDYAKEELERVIFELYDGSFLALCADYFEELAKHAVKKQVDLVGHFDLPTKYNADGTFVNERDPAYLKLALKTADDPIAKRAELEEQYMNDVADAVNAAQKGYVDDVIEPAQTRQILAAALEMLSGKRENRPAKKHGNMPL